MKFLKELSQERPVRILEGQSFSTYFIAPEDYPYCKIPLRCYIFIPPEYPLKSPSIGFEPGQVWHPNVDFESGSICLDVLNEGWNQKISIELILDFYLPQLLKEPNFKDPLNLQCNMSNFKEVQHELFKNYEISIDEEENCPAFWSNVGAEYLAKLEEFRYFEDNDLGL